MKRIKDISYKLNLYNDFLKSEDKNYLNELKSKILVVMDEFNNINYKILF